MSEPQITSAEQIPSLQKDQERALRAIVGDLWQHSERLVKAELALGMSELERHLDEGKRALRDAAVMGALFYAAYLTLLAALVLGLSNFIPAWLAALIVGFGATAGGYLFFQRTKRAARHAIELPSSSRTQRQHPQGGAWSRSQS